MMRMKVLIVMVSVFLAITGLASRVLAQDWMLMGREGGCVTLADAAARKPLLADIATPDQLVARLRRQGEEVRRQDIVQGDVTVVQIEAPRLGLGLIFVPPSMCQ